MKRYTFITGKLHTSVLEFSENRIEYKDGRGVRDVDNWYTMCSLQTSATSRLSSSDTQTRCHLITTNELKGDTVSLGDSVPFVTHIYK